MLGPAIGCDSDDVKTANGFGTPRITTAPDVRRQGNPPLRRGRHRLNGRIGSPSRLDLDEGGYLTAPHDEIHFAERRLEPARQQPVALYLQ